MIWLLDYYSIVYRVEQKSWNINKLDIIIISIILQGVFSMINNIIYIKYNIY